MPNAVKGAFLQGFLRKCPTGKVGSNTTKIVNPKSLNVSVNKKFSTPGETSRQKNQGSPENTAEVAATGEHATPTFTPTSKH